MRNLLSEQTKHELKVLYWYRLATVGLIFLSALLVIGIIALFPSYILLKTNESVLHQKSSLFREQKNTEEASAASLVRITNMELTLLSSIKQEMLFSERLAEIVGGQPKGIVTDHIMFVTQKDKEEGVFTMGGTSATRDSLLSLERLLKQQPDFKTVTLPVSNLAEDHNIQFSLTARGSF